MNRQSRPHLLVIVLIVVLTATAAAVGMAWWTWPAGNVENLWLQKTYGPTKHSQYDEEWILRDFFGDRRDGVFVDVGAAHYRDYSNAYFLEVERAQSGLAVNAQTSYAADYATHRPEARFATFFVSDASDAQATLYVNGNTWVASEKQSFTSRWDANTSSIQVPTITLNDLLKASGVTGFDFLSMDIELAEPRALAGFDIETFHPALVRIEAHPEVRQRILDYFQQHGYVVIGKYLRMDVKNLCFMPAGHRVPPLPADVSAAWTDH